MNVFETFWKRGKEIPVFSTEHVLTKLWTKKSARFAIIVGLILIMFVCFYPLFSSFSPDEQISGAKLLSPNLRHPLGTDQFGRDVLTRIASGGLRSLGSAILVLSLILLVSIALGTFFGMIGGIFDAIAMRVIDVFLALPPIVLALGIVGVLGIGFENLLLAIFVSSLAFLYASGKKLCADFNTEKRCDRCASVRNRLDKNRHRTYFSAGFRANADRCNARSRRHNHFARVAFFSRFGSSAAERRMGRDAR